MAASILLNDGTSSLLLVEDVIVTSSASSSTARKRRRKIEDNGIIDTPASKKKFKSMTSSDDLLAPPPLVTSTAEYDNHPLPIITVLPSRSGPMSQKRPQLKYDPSTPMSPTQTSAWRAEQRRKRNRESAAACRRKQRETVSILEVEVANWKRKFDDAIALVKAREGEDAASKLVNEIEQTFVIQPSKTTSTIEVEEEDDATYEDSASYGTYSSPSPPSQCVPDKIESSSTGSSSSSGLSNIVSPAYDKSNINFLEAYSFDMNYDEEMHFPILDDDDDDNDNDDEHYYKEFKTISRIKEDNSTNTNSKKKMKKKNKHHYSELITTSAEGIHFVRLLMKYQVGDDWRREGGYEKPLTMIHNKKSKKKTNIFRSTTHIHHHHHHGCVDVFVFIKFGYTCT
jgi:hypothetical protein